MSNLCLSGMAKAFFPKALELDADTGQGGRGVGEDCDSIPLEGFRCMGRPGGESAPFLVAVQEGAIVTQLLGAGAWASAVGEQLRRGVMNPESTTVEESKRAHS